MSKIELHHGDCREVLRALPESSVHCVVTSPPYFGLRDYGVEGQIGLEQTPDEYVAEMVAVFREVRRVLRDDGTLWLNLGDSYNNRTKVRTSSHQPSLNGFTDDNWADRAARGGVRMSNMPGLKEKDLIGIPWRVAFALQADGWYLRQDIIWNKPNPMPESVKDRCTKAHEYIFMLSKSARYFFDWQAMREDAVKGAAGSSFNKGKTAEHQLGRSSDKERTEDGKRNRRSVWTVATVPFKGAHFATFPPALIEPCILAGCPEGGTVLDPFNGAGTTGLVCQRLSRNYIGIELNEEYLALTRRRLGLSEMVTDTAYDGVFDIVFDVVFG
jgi:DNA modification methylase